MNYELEQRVRTDLSAGEKLLWSGQPAGGVRFRAADILMIPFSLLWGGFAVFWETMVLRQGAPGFMAMWGIPFVLMGVYIVVGRFFVDAAVRARTYYALTNQRVVILSGLWSRELKSLWLRNLPEIVLREGMGALGTIEFGTSAMPMGQWFRGTSWPGMSRYQPPSFDLIENPGNVYNLIRSAKQEVTAVGT